MKSFAVAKRYSAALWGASKDVPTAENWLASLRALSGMMQESKDLANVLNSPLFSFEKKWAVLSEILEKIGTPPFVKNFVERLMQAGRMAAFSEVVEAFRQRVLEAKGVLELSVESALPLTEEQKKDLTVRFEKLTSKKVTIESHVTPGLLAGMKVSYGGKTYDGSLETHLKNLEKYLLKEDLVTHATA